MTEQNNESKPAPCGPGCACGAAGGSSRMKYVIGGIVILAALAVVAGRFHGKRDDAAQSPKTGYAAALPEMTRPAPPPAAPAEVVSNVWRAPLKSLADLSMAAADTDGAFIVLPSKDAAQTAAAQKEVAAAADTLKARGFRMGVFLLSQDAPEYADLAQQVGGVPAVLAIRHGFGSALVQTARITPESLLRAFVTASRPSACDSSGCGGGAGGNQSSGGCK